MPATPRTWSPRLPRAAVAGAALTVLWFAAGGCHNAGVGAKPAAKVTSVRLVEQTPQAARIEATVLLTNRGDAALPLVRSEYTIDLGSAGKVSLTDEPNRTLPANGRQTVTLPAVIPTKRGLQGATYKLSGSITYQPPGEVRQLLTETSVPLPGVGFSSRGRLSE